MKCDKCLCDRPENDFFRQGICYKCLYRQKLGLLKENSKKTCEICKLEIPSPKIKYCSMECAEIGKREKRSNTTYNKLRKYLPNQTNSGYRGKNSLL
jgi:hypothetical protein